MYIHIKVKTGAKEELFEKKSDTQFLVSVREEAERNLANSRIIQIFRDFYGVKNVRIVNGHHSTSKLLYIDVD